MQHVNHVNSTTIRAFEFVRSQLGHGATLTPNEVYKVTNTQRDLEGDLAEIEPQVWEEGGEESAWWLVARRYVNWIDRESERDKSEGGVGISGPSLFRVCGRWLLVHQTCTSNTVIVANESQIAGWSWTRKEIAGVPLTFGPPPEWLVPHLSRNLVTLKSPFDQEVQAREEQLVARVQRENPYAVGMDLRTGGHISLNDLPYGHQLTEDVLAGWGANSMFFVAPCPRCGEALNTEHINCEPSAEQTVYDRIYSAADAYGHAAA